MSEPAPPKWSKWIFDAEDDRGRHYWRYLLNPEPGTARYETKCNEDHVGAGYLFKNITPETDLYMLCRERARAGWWWLFEDQPKQLSLFGGDDLTPDP